MKLSISCLEGRETCARHQGRDLHLSSFSGAADAVGSAKRSIFGTWASVTPYHLLSLYLSEGHTRRVSGAFADDENFVKRAGALRRALWQHATTMTVPFTGALILIVGLCLVFVSPKLLYGAMIIAIPFTATAVLNLQFGGEEKGVMAWFFLGALWVLREAVSGVPPWRKTGWLRTRRARRALLAFLGAVIASLCVPLVLNGTVWVPVMDALTTTAVSQAIKLSSFDVTQAVYLCFGIVLTILIAAENCAPGRFLQTVKLYVGSCAMLAAWGVFQFWCYFTGHRYPAFIFNNSLTKSALGYKQTITLGSESIVRISSGALEPSVLASELLIGFVVLLLSRSFSRPLFSQRWDDIALALITVALILSTSTTAYAGMLGALLVVGIASWRAGESGKLYFVLVGLAIAAGIIAITVIPLVSHVAAIVGPSKLEEFSGLQRFGSIPLAARDFLRFPILGVGWHNVLCWDWIFLILANTGLAGFLAFIWFLYPVLSRLWFSAQSDCRIAAIALATMAFILILAEAGVGLEYAAGYDWLFFGLGASAAALTGIENSQVANRVAARSGRALPPQTEQIS